MKKLKILLLCFFTCLCVACTNDKEYIRDTTPGSYEEISFMEAKEKIENGDTFIALFSQTKCTHCQEYKESVLDPYLETHHITLYEINITNEDVPKEAFTEIQNYFVEFTKEEEKQFLGTPFTMIVQDGNLAEGVHGTIVEEDLEQLVVKYQLDAKVEE